LGGEFILNFSMAQGSFTQETIETRDVHGIPDS
jgi:hypothetical protein